MTATTRRFRSALLAFAWLALLVVSAAGYVFLPGNPRWPDGQIVMHLQFGPGRGTNTDGTTSWGQAAEGALARWNQYLERVQFGVVPDSRLPIGNGNGVSNVFFDDTYYGVPFTSVPDSNLGYGALAVATTVAVGGVRTEADVIFNSLYNWNSYSGPLDRGTTTGRTYDFTRVALHEFGHVLGLDHPDRSGQQVFAQMNARGNDDLDTLAADDIAGARALYNRGGGGGGTAPGAPVRLTGSSSGSSVALQWGAPTSGGAPASYMIEAGSSPGLSNLANFNTGSLSTAFSTTGVGAGVYYVRVRATNSAGTSSPSNEWVLTVSGGGGCSSVPGAPSGLFVTTNSGGTVGLAWTAASGAPTSYIIQAGSSPGLSNLANSDLGSTSTTFSVSAVGAGTYYVRVRGKNACGTGAPSPEVQLTVGQGSGVRASVTASLSANPVPFSGSPAAACGGSRDTWFYNVILTETAGVSVTFNRTRDIFSGSVANDVPGSITIPARGSTSLSYTWCWTPPTQQTAQSTFTGTDANGNAITVTTPVVTLLAK